MVKIEAQPLLSTKNVKEEGFKFDILDSSSRRINEEDEYKSMILELLSQKTENRLRFIVNWTNQKTLAALNYTDTEELHGKTLTVTVEPTKYKDEDTTGIRIASVE